MQGSEQPGGKSHRAADGQHSGDGRSLLHVPARGSDESSRLAGHLSGMIFSSISANFAVGAGGLFLVGA